ncbi:TerD family protein [Halomonas sediminis]
MPVSFEGNAAGRVEKSLMLCEVYQRNGAWKVKAVDQGFAGGMTPLTQHFGVDVDERLPASAASPSPNNTTPSSSTAEKHSPINLSKITLEKKGDSISLEKKSSGFGRIHVNLNWNQQAGTNQNTRKPGLMGSLFGGGQRGGSSGIDLDLGCMVEYKDGKKAIVQALGNNFGEYECMPFIVLDGDDRTGSANAGENLYINGQQWGDIKRVMLFAFIYEGVPNWAQTNGHVVIKAPDQPDIEIKMDASGSDQSFCVVAMLENRNNTLAISKEVNYFPSHLEADEHYGFGFRWKKGSK